MLKTILELEKQFVFPTYDRAPVVFVRGEGSKLYDSEGRAYVDFLSGIAVNALGYHHPEIVATLADQAAKILHTSNLFHNEYQAALAAKLAEHSGLRHAFFCNSGTEAVEAAIKVARKRAFRKNGESPTQFEIVALYDSFHGRTLGALSLTGQEKYRKPFEPLLPGVRFVHANNSAELRAAVTPKTCALILEPIQGEGGIQVLNETFLRTARTLCDEHEALLIFDEVQCGLGRTGKYFAHEHFSVKPDLLTLAKPLGLGVPMGALLGNEKTCDAFTAGAHGSTFGGGPLACRLSLKFFEILERENLLEQIRLRGAFFRQQLEALKSKHPCVTEIRGNGLMLGAQLNFAGKEIVQRMLEKGFVINCAHEKVLRFLPPYIITESEIASMIRALDGVLACAQPAAGKKVSVATPLHQS